MKTKPSKLDQFAEKLDELFSQKKASLAEARSFLAGEGCSVSSSRLSAWWASRQSAQLQERLLGQITSGARQCREVEAAFGKSPAPELETIVKLHRVLALQFATAGASNPDMLEAAERATKMALEFAKLEAKRGDQALDERRVKLLEAKAALADEARDVTESALSPEEKAMRMKQIFGM